MFSLDSEDSICLYAAFVAIYVTAVGIQRSYAGADWTERAIVFGTYYLDTYRTVWHGVKPMDKPTSFAAMTVLVPNWVGKPK